MIDSVAEGIDLQVENTFKKLKAKSVQLRTEPVRNRVRRLKDLEKWIVENREDIQDAAVADLGKHRYAADISEVQIVAQEIKYAIRRIHRWVRPRRVDPTVFTLGTSSKVIMEPKGICLIIAPWNFPFNLCVGPLIHAIAAGNTVILKPSHDTPKTSELIVRLVNDVFKEGEVEVFEGDVTISQKLLSLPFDHIFFTGSPRVGKIVMEAAAKNLSSVTLELGGKTPVIVDKTASLNDAAEKIAWGKLLNTGQACVAPDYLLVQEEVSSKLITLLKEKLSQLNETGTSDHYQLINEKHFENEVNFIEDAVEKGAKVSFGGQHNKSQLAIEPTLIEDVDMTMRVMDEEIFGPILPIITFQKIDEVIDIINSKPKPLGLNIFSRNSGNIDHISRSTSSGAIAVNDTIIQFGHPSLPFGGIGESGLGKSHGYYGFRAFSNEKAFVKQRIGLTILKLIYPPYNWLTRKILDLHLKYL